MYSVPTPQSDRVRRVVSSNMYTCIATRCILQYVHCIRTLPPDHAGSYCRDGGVLWLYQTTAASMAHHRQNTQKGTFAHNYANVLSVYTCIHVYILYNCCRLCTYHSLSLCCAVEHRCTRTLLIPVFAVWPCVCGFIVVLLIMT